MYADRNGPARKVNPASLGIAMAVNAAAVAALLFASPTLVFHEPDPPLTIRNIPVDPPPEPLPLPEPARPTTPHQQRIAPPDPVVKTPPVADAPYFPPQPPQPPVGVDGGSDGGGGTAIVDPPRPVPPVLTQPGIDPRYAALFQPLYPAEERRAGREGRVVVRVLVGMDGRVKQVEKVSATSDAFFAVTEQRALAKWRFTPATRDGIPVEGWRTMALRFVMTD